MKSAYEVHARVHRDREEGRPAAHRRTRRRNAGRRLLHPAHGLRRRRAHGAHRAGRNLRPRPRAHQGGEFRRRARHRQQHGVRTHRRSLHLVAREASSAPAASSTSAISTSIANAQEPWWARIRSADSTCPARIQRRAARTICYLFTQAKSVAEKLGGAGPVTGNRSSKSEPSR